MSTSGTYNETKDNTYNEKEDQPNYHEIRSEAGLETNNGTDKHNQHGHNSFTKPSDPSSAELETFRKGGCSRGWLIGFGVMTITFICIGVVVAVVVTSPGYGQRLALDGSTGLPSSTPSSTIGASSSLENTTTILNESTSTIAYTTSLSASDDATSSQSEPVSTSLPNIVTTTVSEYETTTQSHKATTEQSSNATATQAESVTATQTRDVTVSQSENTTATQTQGVTASQTDDITATQREIVTATQKQGVTEKQTLNVTGASTESVTTQLQNKTTIDTTEIATTDVVAKSQTEVATTLQTENASTSQTEDAKTSQTEGVTRSQTEDATPSQTEYVTKSQTEGITTTSTEGVTTSQTEDTTTQGVPLTTVAVTTPIDDGCETITFSECQSVGYSRTVFPSLWGDDSQDMAASSYDDYAADVVQRNCSVYSRYFFCSVFFAPCEDWEQLYPCRRVCDAVQRNCAPDLMQYLPCDFFEDDYPKCTLPLNWIELPVISPPTTTGNYLNSEGWVDEIMF